MESQIFFFCKTRTNPDTQTNNRSSIFFPEVIHVIIFSFTKINYIFILRLEIPPLNNCFKEKLRIKDSPSMLEMYTMKKDVRTTLELFMLKSYYFCQALITTSDD